MAAESTPTYRFGDLLALARQSWLGQMTGRLESLGYAGYRRSDAAALRTLWRGPLPVGRLGAVLGVTRQAARKAAEALEQRGYATAERDPDDTRQLNVTLTPAGREYARAITAVIEELNREVAKRVSPAQLAAADSVLRAALFDDSASQRAAQLPPPSGHPSAEHPSGPPARTLPERRAAALERLRANGNLWLATGGGGRGPHLIPVSYWWDGARLLTATFENSRTLKNIQAQPAVRASIGGTADVLMIDATASVVAAEDLDPAAVDGYARASGLPPPAPGFVYVELVPERMQVWRGRAEFSGRTVMRAGAWLDDPVD